MNVICFSKPPFVSCLWFLQRLNSSGLYPVLMHIHSWTCLLSKYFLFCKKMNRSKKCWHTKHLKNRYQQQLMLSLSQMELFTEAVGFGQQVLTITATLYITEVVRCLSRLVCELRQFSDTLWSRKDEGWWELYRWDVNEDLLLHWETIGEVLLRDTEGINPEVNTENTWQKKSYIYTVQPKDW